VTRSQPTSDEGIARRRSSRRRLLGSLAVATSSVLACGLVGSAPVGAAPSTTATAPLVVARPAAGTAASPQPREFMTIYAGVMLAYGAYKVVDKTLTCRKQFPGAPIGDIAKCVLQDSESKRAIELQAKMKAEFAAHRKQLERIEGELARSRAARYKDLVEPLLQAGSRGWKLMNSLSECLVAAANNTTCQTYSSDGAKLDRVAPTSATIAEIESYIAYQQKASSVEKFGRKFGSYADILQRFVGTNKSAETSILGLTYLDAKRDYDGQLKPRGGFTPRATIVTQDFAQRVDNGTALVAGRLEQYFALQRQGLTLRINGTVPSGSSKAGDAGAMREDLEEIDDVVTKGATAKGRQKVPSLTAGAGRFSFVDKELKSLIPANAKDDTAFIYTSDRTEGTATRVFHNTGTRADRPADQSKLAWANGGQGSVQEIFSEINSSVGYAVLHKTAPAAFPRRIWARASVKRETDLTYFALARAGRRLQRVRKPLIPANGWRLSSDRKAGTTCSLGLQVHDRQPGEPPFDHDTDDYLPPELRTTKDGWDALVTIVEPLWSIHRAPVTAVKSRPAGIGMLVRCASDDPNSSGKDVNSLSGESLADVQVSETSTPWLMRKKVVGVLS